MAKVKKANRVLTVQGNEVTSYLKEGYDQIDENGEVLKRATGGRNVSLAEHNKVLDELDELKKASSGVNEIGKELVEEMKKEIKALKSENTKLKKAVEEQKGE